MATVNYLPDGRMVVALSEEDVRAIAVTAQSEVGHFGKYGEDELNRAIAGVTDTVLNRVASGMTGDTVIETVNDPGEFTGISDAGGWVAYENKNPLRDEVLDATEAHIAARYSGAPSIVGSNQYFGNPAVIATYPRASAKTKANTAAMVDDYYAGVTGNVFGNVAAGDYHLHGTQGSIAGLTTKDLLDSERWAPSYSVGAVDPNSPEGYVLSETGNTFGTLAYSPERPSVKQPQQLPTAQEIAEAIGIAEAPGVDIGSTDFLASTLDTPKEVLYGQAQEADLSALAGYGIPGGVDLSSPEVATSRPVESTAPSPIPGGFSPLSPVGATPSLSALSAPAPQMPSGQSMTMSPEARPSMAASAVPSVPSVPSVSAPAGLMSVPADMQTMFGEPSMPTSFSAAPSMPAPGSLSPVSAAPTPAPMASAADPIFSQPTSATLMGFNSGMPQPAEFSKGFTPQILDVGAPPAPMPSAPAPTAAMPSAPAPAPTMPAAPSSPGPTTTTAPPFGAPAPAPKPAPAAPQAPMPAPSIPTVTSPAPSVPTVSAPPAAPGGLAPPTVATTRPPQHRGIMAPPSKKDLPGLIAGGLFGGIPGMALGVAAPRIAGSIGNLFGGMGGGGGAAVPMGSTISVQQVAPGRYATSLGNVVDVSGNPADVMKQPGGKEALAAAGAASLAGSGLHDSDGGISKEARDAINAGYGGLF